MRSRTEMVTTTFIDSEEDQTETEDSEEDWRPDSSRSSKRRQAKSSKTRPNKRKANSSGFAGKVKKSSADQFKELSNSDDEDYENYSLQSASDHKALTNKLESDQNVPDKSGTFILYLYRKDLNTEYKENSHLCLWRRDGTNLLQKYIRVKTSNTDEFVFTSSSVYSSWDEKRRKEFATIHVKCMEENNRRVTIVSPGELVALADGEAARQVKSTASETPTYDESSNDKTDSQEDEEEEEEEQSYDDPSDGENEEAHKDNEDDDEDDESDNEETYCGVLAVPN